MSLRGTQQLPSQTLRQLHKAQRSPKSPNCLDMSAPQIPNLNTFRRRGGPGRFRSRGGDDDGPGPRGALSKDRVVQGTDNDASVSRLSAVRLGYLDDPYAQVLTPPGLETRRFPIINRGMYVCVFSCRSRGNEGELRLTDQLNSYRNVRPDDCN